MATVNWKMLRQAIATAIKTNGNQEITGQLLQDQLLAILEAIPTKLSHLENNSAFLDKPTADATYLSAEAFAKLFRLVQDDKGNYYIHTPYPLASDSTVSSLGVGEDEGGIGGTSALYQLVDVLRDGDKVSGAEDGNVLMYDAATGKWYGKKVNLPDVDFSDINDKFVSIDGLIESLQEKDVAHDESITALQAKDAAIEQSITSLQSKDTEHSNAIAALQTKDTAIEQSVTSLQGQLNTLVSGDASSAIESFNEVVAFLKDMEDDSTLEGILAGKQNKITETNKLDYSLLANTPSLADFMGNSSIGGTASSENFSAVYWDGTQWKTRNIYKWALASVKPSYTTSEVTEGTRLYFTDDRAKTALKSTTDALSDRIAVFEKMFQWGDGDGSHIKTPYSFASDKTVSSLGVGTDGTGGVSYDRLDSWDSYTSDKAGYVLSAALGWDLKTRLDNLDIGDFDLTDYLTKEEAGKTYATINSLGGYQPLISANNKLAYSLLDGAPTALKNPYALKFGDKSYDGSSAKEITASDLGALTSHQAIYTLTIKNSAGTTLLTYKPATSGTYSLQLTKSVVGLGNVENTALSTWKGTTNITTLGTVTSGTWNGTKIANDYIANPHVTIAGNKVNLGGSLSAATLQTSLDIVTLSTEQTITGKKTFTKQAVFSNGIQIGDAIIYWDSNSNALRTDKSFASDSTVSSLGVGSDEGGTGGAIDLTNVVSHIIPSLSKAYTIGGADSLWKAVYATELYAGNVAVGSSIASLQSTLGTATNNIQGLTSALSSVTSRVGVLESVQHYSLTIKNSAGTTQLTYNPTSASGSITLTQAMVGLGSVTNLAASGYLTALSSGTTNAVSITVGGTTKNITASTMKSSLGLKALAYKDSLTASDIPSLSWSKITSGKPTTLSGYGITDALPLTGGTLSGIVTLDNYSGRYSNISFKNNRVGSGGFADNIINIKDGSDNTIGRFGMYGTTDVSYYYIGHSTYDGDNLRIYTDKLTFGSNTILHSGNIGSQSVSYAASAGNANTLDGVNSTGFIRQSVHTTRYTDDYSLISSLNFGTGLHGIRSSYWGSLFDGADKWGYMLLYQQNDVNGTVSFGGGGIYFDSYGRELYLIGSSGANTSVSLNAKRVITDNIIGNYNAGSATKLHTARTIALSGAVTGTATSFDGSANISIPTTGVNAYYVSGYMSENATVYYGHHPERKGVLPFLYNDLAHLIARGGTCTMYTTTDTDYTQPTLTNTGTLGSDYTTLFDCAPDYFNLQGSISSLSDVVVVDITCPTTYRYTSQVYIDFGAASWRAKDVYVYVWNSSDENSERVYTLKGSIKDSSNGAFYCSFAYDYTDTSGATKTGFNRLRIVLTNFNYKTPRIAQIGVVNYSSSGARMGYVSRGIDDVLYRNFTPAKNATYNLGTNTAKWNNVHASNFYGNIKFATPRTLWGQSFDGGANISGNLTGVGSITGGGLLSLVSTNSDIYLKRNNDNTTSLVLNASAFKPFDVANGLLNLGAASARWKGIYGQTLNLTGSIYLPNETSISAELADGSKYIGLMRLNAANNLLIGRNGAEAGYSTIIYGNTIYLVYGTAGSTSNTALFVSSGGNVGIGTTSPAYKLDVNGTFRASGNATIGGTLNVTGATTLSDKLTISKNGMSVTGAAYFGGGTTYYFGSTGNIYANTLSAGATTLRSTLSVAGNATFSNRVYIGGTSAYIYYDTTNKCLRTNVSFASDSTVSSLGVGEDGEMSGSVIDLTNVASHIIPSLNDGYNLGSESLRWSKLYANGVDCTGDISSTTNISARGNVTAINGGLSGKTLSVSGAASVGSLTVNGATAATQDWVTNRGYATQTSVNNSLGSLSAEISAVDARIDALGTAASKNWSGASATDATNLVTIGWVESKLGGYATAASIPTKTSQLTNDSRFISGSIETTVIGGGAGLVTGGAVYSFVESSLSGYAKKATTLSGYGITDALPKSNPSVTGTLTVAGAVSPSANDTYALGSESLRWSKLYANGVDCTGDISSTTNISARGNVTAINGGLSGKTLSVSGAASVGSLTVNGVAITGNGGGSFNGGTISGDTIFGSIGSNYQDIYKVYINGALCVEDLIDAFGGIAGNGWEIQDTGDAYFQSIDQASDYNLKSIIKDVRLSLGTMANAPLVQFDWTNRTNKKHHVGTIAQYWEGCLPEVVSITKDGTLALGYGELGVAMGISLANHLTDLKSDLSVTDNEVEKLKKRVEELENENKRLQERVDALAA